MITHKNRDTDVSHKVLQDMLLQDIQNLTI